MIDDSCSCYGSMSNGPDSVPPSFWESGPLSAPSSTHCSIHRALAAENSLNEILWKCCVPNTEHLERADDAMRKAGVSAAQRREFKACMPLQYALAIDYIRLWVSTD